MLGRIAQVTEAVDRLMGQLVVDLMRAVDEQAAERHGRVLLEAWLAQACRVTGTSARRMLGTVEVLRRMPATVQGLRDGRLSWAQVQDVVEHARPLTVGQREVLDVQIDELLDVQDRYGADELVNEIEDLARGLTPGRLERLQRRRERGERLVLIPELDGGGQLYGEYGPRNFATIVGALDRDVEPPAVDEVEADEWGDDTALAQKRAIGRQHARRRANRLVEMAEHHLAGCNPDGTGNRTPAVIPGVLLKVWWDELIGLSDTAPQLLHRLSGGAMKLTTDTAARWVDEAGAAARLIVVDDVGEVLGVGRRTRLAPGWLRDAVVARDGVARAPSGTTSSALTADLDHVAEWDADGGPTDVDNLVPLARSVHGAKTDRHWRLHRARDGTLTWTHRQTGLVTRQPPRERRRRPVQPPIPDLPPPPGDPPDE